MQYRLIDCDSHINEPPHIFQDRLPAHLRDRGPRLVELGNGDQGWQIEDRPPNRLVRDTGMLAELARTHGGMVNVTHEMSEQLMRTTPCRFEYYIRGSYDPKAHIEDMALDGCDAAILFPGMAAAVWTIDDPELRVASIRAYNDWLVEEFCSYAPDQLFGLAIVPIDDPLETAVAEVYRAAKTGHRRLHIPNYPVRPLHDPYYDPFWAATQDTGLPVHWHRSNGLSPDYPRWFGPGSGTAPLPEERQRSWPGLPGERSAAIVCKFFAAVFPLTYMLFNGVFERFPNLRMVSAETDIGWLPFLMECCDNQWSRYGVWYGSGATRRPSDYIRGQFFCTFMDDPAGTSMLDRIGVDNVLWSSDYPHGTCTWPISAKYIKQNIGDRTPEEQAKIKAGNVVRLYGLHARL